MKTVTQQIVDGMKESLKSFVPYEEATTMRKIIHDWALANYVPKNKPEDYLKFMNRHECEITKVHPQVTNYGGTYLCLFTVVSQHVYGDCMEECLDQAIEYENGKPRWWYAGISINEDGTHTIKHHYTKYKNGKKFDYEEDASGNS